MKHASASLLLTFTNKNDLEYIIDEILECYTILFDSIYVLKNREDSEIRCLTYNIDISDVNLDCSVKNTISVHRKKITNTIYSINALNQLVEELNYGKKDIKFEVPWENYKNCILITAYDHLKRIDTELEEIIKISEF